MNSEKCKGCKVYDQDCYLSQLNDPMSQNPIKVEECPCIDCIVKVMCEDPCSKFSIHLRNHEGGTTTRVKISSQRRSKK